MRGLPFQNLPAQQDPESILQDRYKQTMQYNRSQYDVELNSLKQAQLSDKDFHAGINKLNARHQQIINQENYKADQQLQQVKRVKALINSNQISPDAGQEAIWRLVLPQETERAMFPTTERAQPFSIAQLSSKAVLGSISELAEAAPTTHEFWTSREKEPKTKQGIINQYSQWRELIQYDALNPLRQRQLDMQWDAYMMGDERYDKWWLNKKERQPIVEIKALRTPGKMGKLMQSRITGVGTATPLSRSIMDKHRSVPPVYEGTSHARPAERPSAESLRRTGTKQAYEEGKRLGYWN